MPRRGYDNIESTKWNGAYTGYSNLGPVRIYGESGAWEIRMSDCPANVEAGIAGLYVTTRHTLADVSTVIQKLHIVATPARKIYEKWPGEREHTDHGKRAYCTIGRG